jgi:hypothetical protein
MKTWRKHSIVIAALAVFVAALACGPSISLGGVQGTVDAAATEASAQLPTLEAQFTEFAADLTQNAPDLGASATAVEATIDAMGGGDVDPNDVLTAAAGTAAPPAPDSGGEQPTPQPPSSGQVTFDGGDDYDTVAVQTISVGQTVNGTINAVFDANNWLFEGTSGQTVTIRVTASGGSDPLLTVINPDGVVVAQDDDGGGGFDSLLTYTLTQSGTYTIRVKVWAVGGYTLSLE